MKINTASIEGYAGMTAEQKVAALEGFELDAVPTDTYNTLKTAHDDVKGKYDALLPEDQRKENELKALRRESAINKHTATLTGQGWTAELAGKAAAALVDGKMEDFFGFQKSHDDTLKAQTEADLLKGTPRPQGGGGGEGMTLEKLRAMTPAQRYEYAAEHPEEYNALYEGGKA